MLCRMGIIMTGQLVGAAGIANPGHAGCFTQKEDRFTLISRIVKVARELWPRKTTNVLADMTGVSERAVKYWLSGQTCMSLENVSDLLRSDDGFEILRAVMGEASPRWWRVAQLAHEQDDAAKKMKNLERHMDRIRLRKQQGELEL